MKWINIFLLLFLSLQLCGQSLPKLTLKAKNESLVNILHKIGTQHNIRFAYDAALLEGEKVTVQLRKEPFEQALNKILKERGLSYEMVSEKHILIIKKEETTQAPSPSSEAILIPKICGSILDKLTNEPLPYANIILKGTTKGITSNASGEFSLKLHFSPLDSLEISYLGYQSQSFAAQELINKPCRTIALEFANFTFENVVITEYVTSGIEQDFKENKIVLRPKKMDVVPGLTESDVLQLVQLLPGVNSPNETASGLHVRGGTPDQNLILLDDIPIYNSGHFFGMISAFNAYLIDEVDVYRSGFGAEYGGRIASVIDMKSKQQIPDKVYVGAGLNLTHGDLIVDIPLFKRKASLLLSGRRSYTDFIQSYTYNQLANRVFQRGKIKEQQGEVDVFDTQTDFYFDDYNARWLQELSEKDRLTISFYGSDNHLNFFSETQEEYTQNEDEYFQNDDLINQKNRGISGKWRRNWSDKNESELALVYSNYNDRSFSSISTDSLEEESFKRSQVNQIQDLTLHFRNFHQFSKHHHLNWGYQFTRPQVRWDISIKELEENYTDSDSLRSDNHSSFGEYAFQSEHFSIDLGLRYQYFSLVDRHKLEPRFSLRYQPIPALQFKIGGGLYNQQVGQIVEFNDLGVNEQLWIMVNDEEYPLIESQHWTGGLLFSKKGFQLDTEAYYKRIDGITSLALSFSESPNVEEDLNEGVAYIYGLDFLLKKRWKNYNNWISYSLGKVDYAFQDFNDDDKFPAPHHQLHVLNWIHQLKLGNWHLSAAWHFSTGKPYTEATNIALDDEDDPYLIYATQNANRLPNRHRLDCSVLYKFPSDLNKKWRGILGFSLLNAYNRNNPLSRQYLVDEDEGVNEIISLNRSLLGITPNVMVRFEWK